MYYANKFNLALGNIKKIWDIIKILHWDPTMLTANPLLKLLKFQKHMVIFQIIWAVTLGIIATNSDEIIRTVNLLKASFSKGADDISSVVTKKVIYELSLPLSIIINKSFELGQFPDKLKIAKNYPYFQKWRQIIN